MAGFIYATKSGDTVSTLYPGDASGLASAKTYVGSNGHIEMGPGTEGVAIGSIADGVSITRLALGQHSRFGTTALAGRPWHDVRAYGAKGDGSTDDTTAVQAAITAAEADGTYCVAFPEGTYKIPSGGLTCKRETWLVGMGSGARITMTSTSATLVKWASSSVGTKQTGGGARNIRFEGAGGSSTSIGVSFGDPAHAGYYAHRLSLIDCDVASFGHGIYIDGPGTISTGENSATDGFVIDRCMILNNVYNGLFCRTTFAIEICTIRSTYFLSNGAAQATGAAIQLSASGGGGGTQASGALNLSCHGCTFNGNGNGTLGQIHCPASAWIELKMDGCSFETIGAGRSHIAALSDGSATYNGPRSRVQVSNCYLQAFSPSSYKNSIILRTGELMLFGNRIAMQAGGSAIAAIAAGLSGQFTAVSLNGNFFQAAGTVANARILDFTGADASNTTAWSQGNIFDGFNGVSSMLINGTGCVVNGDLAVSPTRDHMASRTLAVRNLLVQGSDVNLFVQLDVAGVDAYGKKLEIFRQGGGAKEIGVLMPVVPTANLPAAGSSHDGKILIEDAGSGDRNLVIYAGGQRFRIDGGTNF